MSKEVKKEDGKDNKNMMIIGAVVAFVILTAGYMYYQNNQNNSVSMQVGDKKISAKLR